MDHEAASVCHSIVELPRDVLLLVVLSCPLAGVELVWFHGTVHENKEGEEEDGPRASLCVILL